MAKHLPDPIGKPDPEAQAIIDSIETYLYSDRDPGVIVGGLRHIYHRAELAWDESVFRAKRSMTYAEITERTGDKLGTLQGRIQSHHDRIRNRPRPLRRLPRRPAS